MSAVLENRFYYLDNFETVIHWVQDRHGDLLTEQEQAFSHRFLSLARNSRALLVRLIMRKRDLFRVSKLQYQEIPDLTTARDPLIESGWINLDPELTIHELTELLTKPELRAVFSDLKLSSTQSKAQLTLALIERFSAEDPKTFSNWWPGAQDQLLRLHVRSLSDRLRLMFFGNLHQDWSEFVLAELGMKRFEKVEFANSSRAFAHRSEIDAYLTLHQCREDFENGHALDALLTKVPHLPYTNSWLERRRSRLLFKIARQYERNGQWKQALKAYAASRHPDARPRQLRVLELTQHKRAAWTLAENTLKNGPFTRSLNEAEAQKIGRIMRRIQPASALPAAVRRRPSVPPSITVSLPLPCTPCRVELLARDHLCKPDAPAHYVENTLINALFGLLCWDAFFAAVPGAFFHPFQSQPADLHHYDFLPKRRAQFDACFDLLHTQAYRQAILSKFRRKQGIQNPFITWGVITEELLMQALDCIPAQHLKLWFQRMLLDLAGNCSGFPDLVQFWPDQQRYRMIEVKGPGDRLQDNQIRWLDFFQRHDMPVEVCYVRWAS